MLEFVQEHGRLSAEVMRKAFDATEEEFFHLVKRSWPIQPQIAYVRSCCLVGAMKHMKLLTPCLSRVFSVLQGLVSL